MSMTITIDNALAARITAEAQRTGANPHGLAVAVLREHFPRPIPTPEEHEEWVRGLRALAIDCGVSLPNEAFTSESMYD